MFAIQSFRPDLLLRPVIDNYLLVNAGDGGLFTENRFLPKVNQQISFNLGAAKDVYDINRQEFVSENISAGPNDRVCRLRIYSGMNRLVVNLKPAGWFKLFGVPAHLMVNRSIDLEDICSGEIQSLHHQLLDDPDIRTQIRLLDTFFLTRFFRCRTGYKNIDAAIGLVLASKGNIRIKQLIGDVFLTKRTLERHFLEQTGLCPKMFARIVRFNETLYQLEKNHKLNRAYFAGSNGYWDQSHFINEFRHFAGCAPGQYLRDPEAFPIAGKS